LAVQGLCFDEAYYDDTLENMTLEECCDAATAGKFPLLKIPAMQYRHDNNT
jgi:hypothetical protein